MSRHAYGLARHAFDEDVSALRTAYPQLANVPKRLLFYDLRGRERYGTLDRAAVEEIVRQRVQRLEAPDASALASGLWEAWQRFVSNSDFTPEWLSLSGPDA